MVSQVQRPTPFCRPSEVERCPIRVQHPVAGVRRVEVEVDEPVQRRHTTVGSIVTMSILCGMALNQAAIYAGVEHLGLTYEHAKLLSAGIVFSFNFALRKLLLFTRG